jgi:hypothetical protein
MNAKGSQKYHRSSRTIAAALAIKTAKFAKAIAA